MTELRGDLLETRTCFDAWMLRLDRAAQIRSRLRRRIQRLSDSGAVELWARLRRLAEEANA